MYAGVVVDIVGWWVTTGRGIEVRVTWAVGGLLMLVLNWLRLRGYE